MDVFVFILIVVIVVLLAYYGIRQLPIFPRTKALIGGLILLLGALFLVLHFFVK